MPGISRLAYNSRMTFRRHGWALVPWYLYLALGWCFAALFAAAFVIALRLPDPWMWERVFTTAMIGVVAGAAVRMAVGAHRWIAGFRQHYLTVADDGVRFRLPGVDEVSLAWSEIESVTSERRWLTLSGPWPFGYRAEVHTIGSSRGRFEFTSMEIPRAARAAKEIRLRLL
jgi:hypothetical protein